MDFEEIINAWKNKKVLVIGEALIDKYIIGTADKISPDAPVPNIKIEKNISYLGGIGMVLKFIKSLGGIPLLCTMIGEDFEGSFFLKRLKDLELDSSGIIINKNLSTPQITRIKAMGQHLLRLETDYSGNIEDNMIEHFLNTICSKFNDIDSILILNYGVGGLFTDKFIENLLRRLKEKYEAIPIIARPNFDNYYLFENIDMIKMTLHKALQTSSIECCTETSVSIIGKKILTNTKSKNVLLNDIESVSYLFSKNMEEVVKINSILKNPVRSYVSVGSSIMAILGLAYSISVDPLDIAKLALYAATFSASLPPVEFYSSQKFINFIKSII